MFVFVEVCQELIEDLRPAVLRGKPAELIRNKKACLSFLKPEKREKEREPEHRKNFYHRGSKVASQTEDTSRLAAPGCSQRLAAVRLSELQNEEEDKHTESQRGGKVD